MRGWLTGSRDVVAQHKCGPWRLNPCLGQNPLKGISLGALCSCTAMPFNVLPSEAALHQGLYGGMLPSLFCWPSQWRRQLGHPATLECPPPPQPPWSRVAQWSGPALAPMGCVHNI